LGFLPALEMLVQDMRADGTAANVVVSGSPRRLQSEVEVAAFRVTQEALANAERHAHATQITVAVTFAEQELAVSVQDDGDGFTPPATPDELTSSGHFGLVGMQERVRLLGGRFEVESQPGAGTRIVARFPV
jgi:signal transduction histidine kinase